METVSEGNENYNALQATLHQQENNGLEYTVNYTYSKALNVAPAGILTSTVWAPAAALPSRRIRITHTQIMALRNFDVRHNLSGTAVYQLPFGNDKRYGAHWNRLTDEADRRMGTVSECDSSTPVFPPR